MTDQTLDALDARRRFFAREMPPGYAAELAQTLAEPTPAEATRREPVVVFRVAETTLALSARLVKAVTEPVPVCRVPHRRKAVLLGLVAYAGEVLPCCSLTRLMGLPGEETTGKLLVLEQRAGVRWAVPVAEVLGVPSVELQPAEPPLEDWCSASLRDERSQSIPLLAPDTLFARMLQAAG